ncbi:MAG: TolC family protein [Synergistaceae bacterium]|nr:TolC family protein [Synergistaceae bacterium]
MKTKILIASLLILSFFIALPQTANADGSKKSETVGLELWKAMEMAEQNNPGLKGSNVEREKSEIDVKIAEGMKSPKIDIWGTTTLSDQPYTVIPIREAGVFPPLDRHITRFGVELNIPLYTGGKLEAERMSAQKVSAAAYENNKQDRQDLLYSVVSVFSRSLYFRDLKEASSKRILALEDGERVLLLLLREGRIPKLDLLRLQTHLSQARHDHIVLDQAEKDSLSLLGTLTGNPDPVISIVEIPTETDLGAFDEIEQTDILANNHALKRSLLLSEASYAKSQAVKGETKPQLSFFGRGTGSFGSDAELYDDWQAGLQVTLKVWDGHVSKNRIKKSLLDIEKARLDLDQTRNQTLNEAREALGAVREAGSKIITANKQSEEAKEALRIERLIYETGESTITDLLSAESELWIASANKSKAYYEKIASEANVLRILGELSPERMRFTAKESFYNKKISAKDEVVR